MRRHLPPLRSEDPQRRQALYYLAQANIGGALVGDDDRAFVLAESLEDSSISIGAVAVGSECRKQLPVEFIGKW